MNPRPSSRSSRPGATSNQHSFRRASAPRSRRSAGWRCSSRSRRASRRYSPAVSGSADGLPRPAINGAVNSRIACVLGESSIVIGRGSKGQERAATPRRFRASAAATRRPSTSSVNPPCRPPATPGHRARAPPRQRGSRLRYVPAVYCSPSTSAQRAPPLDDSMAGERGNLLGKPRQPLRLPELFPQFGAVIFQFGGGSTD